MAATSSSGIALGVANDVHGEVACPPATLDGAGDDRLDGALLELEVRCRGSGAAAGGSAATEAGGPSRDSRSWFPFGMVVQCFSTRCNLSSMVDRASSVVLESPRLGLEPTVLLRESRGDSLVEGGKEGSGEG